MEPQKVSNLSLVSWIDEFIGGHFEDHQLWWFWCRRKNKRKNCSCCDVGIWMHFHVRLLKWLIGFLLLLWYSFLRVPCQTWKVRWNKNNFSNLFLLEKDNFLLDCNRGIIPNYIGTWWLWMSFDIIVLCFFVCALGV